MKYLPALALTLLLSFTPFAAISAEININTADPATLQELDGVGPAKADAIVTYRESNGAFESVDELSNVDGIGVKTVEANRDRMTVR